ILWQNTDGQAAVWLMDGTTLTSGSGVGPNPGTAWHIKGASDFDSDGKSDIIWQNNNGQVVIWYLDGTQFMSGAAAGANPGSAWQVSGAAGVTGAALADLLWQDDHVRAAPRRG